MKLLFKSMLAMLIIINSNILAQVTVTGSTGANGSYSTLKGAFDAINANSNQTGNNISISITGNTTETSSAVLNNPSGENWTTLTISPSGGERNISGSVSAPLIDLNGVSNVTIDGRIGGSGSNKNLTISNTNTSGQAIRFINGATYNNIKYCIVMGVNNSITSGVVVFSTASGATGNSNNTLEYNDLKSGTTNAANIIYSQGTTGNSNTNNNISHNNISDWFSESSSPPSCGIGLRSNSNTWNISNNSLFQTTTRTTGTYILCGIYTHTEISIHSLTITNNYIGGSSPNAIGTWAQTTSSNQFIGISLRVGTTSATSVQGNVIKNISISSTTGETSTSGISLVFGSFNIGNVNPNTISDISFTNTGTSTEPLVCAIRNGPSTPYAMNISNNIIENLSVSATGSGAVKLRGISTSLVGASWTVSGNTIRYLTNSTTNELHGITMLSTRTDPVQQATNNLIHNLDKTATGSDATNVLVGMYIAGNDGGAFNISNNTVHTLTSSATNTGSAGSASVIGIAHIAATTAGQTVSQNTIYNLSNNSTSGGAFVVTGLLYDGPTSGTNIVERNYIYGLNASGTGIGANSPILKGMETRGGLTTFQNNMIALGNDVGNEVRIFGIREDFAGTNTYYHNSINIVGTTASGSNRSFAFARNETGSLTLRNNIFRNVRTGGGGNVGIGNINAAATGWTSTSSNYNLIHTGVSNEAGQWLSSGSPTSLSNWQYNSGGDANSFFGDPQFLSLLNLHITTNTPTPIEAVGTSVDVTNDFDGDARASLTPVDIGADAGNFIPYDLTAPSISYTTLDTTGLLTNRTLSNVTITDDSGVDWVNAPRIYFKKSTDANTFSGNTSTDNGWKWTATSSNSSPASFLIDYSIILGGLVSPGDVIQYFVVAQDLAAGVNIGIKSGTFEKNPSSVELTSDAFPIGGSIYSYNIVRGFSGEINVGTGQTYSTLTSEGGLFQAINDGRLIGNTIVNIVTDLSETATHALNQWIEEGDGPFTLTIRPADASNKNIYGSTNQKGLIRLNGADRVTIDGRYDGGGHYLSFTNDVNDNHTTIQLISLGPNQGATNNTIRNCKISTRKSLISTVCAVSIGWKIFEKDNNDNNTIRNNIITNAATGIFVSGGGATNNINIIGNLIGSNESDYSIGRIGIEARGISNSNISENTVFNIVAHDLDPKGIFAGGVNNSIIGKNILHTIKDTDIDNNATGIDISSNLVSNNLTLENNLIYNILAAGDKRWNVWTSGIRIQSGGGYKLYYNTVNLYGTIDYGTDTSYSAALYNDQSTYSTLDIRNNVFVNSINKTTSPNTSYSIYTRGSINTINNNNYYGSGPQYILGYRSSNRTTLADWRSATGQDGSSVSGDPGFISQNNLKPDVNNSNCWTLNGKGIPISSINSDYDDNPRSTSVSDGATDIGAYEFTPNVSPPTSNASGVPVPNTTTTYTYAGNTLVSIDWGETGTVPNEVDVKYYPGTNPPPPLTGNYSNAYWDINGTGGTGFTYDITLHYTPAVIGTIGSENDIIIAKRDGGVWTPYSNAVVNTSNKTVTLTGLTSFSQFALTDVNSPLPIQLSAFYVEVKGRDVILNWETKTEIMSNHFEIERYKVKGKDEQKKEWEKIASINAHGNSNSPKNYSFNDKKLGSGKYFYRLKMIDTDGSFTYSNEVEAEISLPTEFTLMQNYPNPFNPSTVISYQLPAANHVTLKVYDVLGREVVSLVNEQKDAGAYEINYDASKLSSGIYIYKLNAGNYSAIKKMMIVK